MLLTGYVVRYVIALIDNYFMSSCSPITSLEFKQSGGEILACFCCFFLCLSLCFDFLCISVFGLFLSFFLSFCFFASPFWYLFSLPVCISVFSRFYSLARLYVIVSSFLLSYSSSVCRARIPSFLLFLLSFFVSFSILCFFLSLFVSLFTSPCISTYLPVYYRHLFRLSANLTWTCFSSFFRFCLLVTNRY